MKKLVFLLFVAAACTDEPSSKCTSHEAPCLVAGDIHCAEASIRTCVEAQDGCLVWTDFSACDDGLFCNGEETCNNLDGCVSPGRPCDSENDQCDEESDTCVAPGGWKMVAAGADHTCAIDIGGVPYCWGRDKFGQIGNGDQAGSSGAPSRVDTGGLGSAESFVSLAAGSFHTCGLTNHGRVYCWGLDYAGQIGNGEPLQNEHSPAPVDESALPAHATVKRLSAGGNTTCALTFEGHAYCWGNDWAGQLGDGEDTEQVLSPSPVLVDYSGLEVAPVLREISVGYAHACALDEEGLIYCWGSNSARQVSMQEAPGKAHTPVEVYSPGVYMGLSAGYLHTCALVEGGIAYCWGNGSSGELGSGDFWFEYLKPVDTSGLGDDFTFAQVSCGRGHTCGVSPEGEVACWGSGWLGQHGTAGEVDAAMLPVFLEFDADQSAPKIEWISSGDYHTCALGYDERLFCWGSDHFDQLGDGGRMNHAPVPRPVDMGAFGPDARLVSLAVGSTHACGVLEDGSGLCWGADRGGQLGNAGELSHAHVPGLIDMSGLPADTVFAEVQAASRHSCGRSQDGDIYCWGSGGTTLGLGRDYELTFEVPEPIDVESITTSRRFVQLRSNGMHSCALADDGIAYCWGTNSGLQLGCGDACAAGVPSRVDTSGLPADFEFLGLTTGGCHTCGVANDSHGYCWGHNYMGAIGNPAVERAAVPVMVEEPWPDGESQWVEFAAGGQIGFGSGHTCGLNIDGQVFCWGWGSYGQRGDNSTEQFGMSPSEIDTTHIQGSDVFVHIAAGMYHTCGITEDEVAYCWGFDAYGQLGTGQDLLISPVPRAVDTTNLNPDETFVQLAGGTFHTCGFTSLGKVFCWGYDYLGALGDGGPPAEVPVPLEIVANGG